MSTYPKLNDIVNMTVLNKFILFGGVHITSFQNDLTIIYNPKDETISDKRVEYILSLPLDKENTQIVIKAIKADRFEFVFIFKKYFTP